MNYFFTGDTHFGHKNVITYSNRPYTHADEMDEALVDNWNHMIRQNDSVYHLGDFSFYDEKRSINLARRLNGQKHLLFGNHDKRLRRSAAFCSQWIWCKDLADITVNDQRIVLLHYPLVTWNKSHYGAWSLHGHCHNSLRDDPNALRLDVGVDAWNMFPVPFDEVKEKMSKKTFVSVDHHGAEE